MTLVLAADNVVQGGFNAVVGYIEKVTDILGPAGPYVMALIVFLLGKWIVGKIRKLVEMAFARTGVDEKLSSVMGGDGSDAGKFIGLLVYAVLMIFVILFALDKAGMSEMATPLRDMLGQITGYLPKILGAGVAIYIGMFLAKILKQVVENVLGAAKLDERIGAYTGAPISQALANVVFWIVCLLAMLVALKQLQIDAITGPVQNIVDQVSSVLPNLLLAGVLIGVGFIIARVVRNLVESALNGVGADAWPAKLGIAAPESGSKSLSSIVGLVAMVSVMVLILTSAIDTLKIPILSEASQGFVGGYYNILLAILILGAGFILSNFAHRNLVDKNVLLAKVAKIGILVMTVVVALRRSNLAPDLTGLPYEYAIYALALAVGVGGAIALGLGGKDFVSHKLERYK